MTKKLLFTCQVPPARAMAAIDAAEKQKAFQRLSRTKIYPFAPLMLCISETHFCPNCVYQWFSTFFSVFKPWTLLFLSHYKSRKQIRAKISITKKQKA